VTVREPFERVLDEFVHLTVGVASGLERRRHVDRGAGGSVLLAFALAALPSPSGGSVVRSLGDRRVRALHDLLENLSLSSCS
jgi:hypothetical protein